MFINLIVFIFDSVYIIDSSDEFKDLKARIIRLPKYRRPKAFVAHHLSWAEILDRQLKERHIYVVPATATSRKLFREMECYVYTDHKKICDFAIALLYS